MKMTIILGFSTLLISCGMKTDMFDGKRICLEKSQYHISSDQRITGIVGLNKDELEKFDDDSVGDGILSITYRSRNSLYDKLMNNMGSKSKSKSKIMT